MTSTLSAPARDVGTLRATHQAPPRAALVGAVHARGALGGAGHRAVRGRPGRQLTGAPAPVGWTLFLACYAAGGWEPGLAGLLALRDKTLDVDLLMVLAAIGAASSARSSTAALLIVIFATSGALEAVATHRTAQARSAACSTWPPSRPPGSRGRRRGDGGRRGPRSATSILVRPGERIGADGRVLSRVAARSTRPPSPASRCRWPRSSGDEVFAGTAQRHRRAAGAGGPRGQDSVVARIVAMVEEASATKARTQLFIEKVEQRYSVGMVAATVAPVRRPARCWALPSSRRCCAR